MFNKQRDITAAGAYFSLQQTAIARAIVVHSLLMMMIHFWSFLFRVTRRRLLGSREFCSCPRK
jgi:hypothetical protein